MRQSTRSTLWTCDACGWDTVQTGDDQETPPSGWRLVELLPVYVNLALEPNSRHECTKRVVCDKCMDAPVVMSSLFSNDGG